MGLFKKIKSFLFYSSSSPFLWVLLSLVLGILIGTSSALFLFILEYVTTLRHANPAFLYGLPLGGFLIGYLYFHFGGRANKGNNLLLQEYHHPIEKISFKMAPFVLLGTWITHLFGGSAGREGTAIQIGGTLADQFTQLFKLTPKGRQVLLLMGISGGFASVFGTPLAGALFALELMGVSRKKYTYIFPVLLTAFISHYVCLTWGITHTIYVVESVPPLSLLLLLKIGLAGILFGLTAVLFVKSTNLVTYLSHSCINYAPLRPFWGGIVLILLCFLIQDQQFLGLGIETIVHSFSTSQPFAIFLLKILFTAVTLGTGFKGGEVTPLFFIGATLGSFLALYLQLPLSFVASLGFVAVFAGATKTPFACLCMAGELFGTEVLIYACLACLIAYRISGKHSIYKIQLYQ
ncbi:chloride channel protein [Myroides odoratus]|uniref:chloride channel protein n=1 Tax=Myroides odoratus TaxID=256 RepID=UPI0039B01914